MDEMKRIFLIWLYELGFRGKRFFFYLVMLLRYLGNGKSGRKNVCYIILFY